MSLTKKIKCFFNFHNMEVVEEFSNSFKKTYCSNCKKYLWIDIDKDLCVPWNADAQMLTKFYQKPTDGKIRGLKGLLEELKWVHEKMQDIKNG